MGPITVSHVLVAVSRRFNVTPDMLRGPRRARAIAWPRQVAYLIASEMCPHLSLPQLGKRFDRDHTTILLGLRVVKKRVAADPALQRTVNEIERELRASFIPSTQVIHGANAEPVLEASP